MRRNRHTGMITVINGSTIIKGFLSILVLLLFIFSASGVLTSLRPEYRISSGSVNSVANQFSGKMLFSMLASENHYFFNALPGGEPAVSVTPQLLKLTTNISMDDPRSLLGRELPGFSIFDTEILVAGKGTNYTNMPYESSPPGDVAENGKDAALQNVDQIKEPQKQVSQDPKMTTGGRKVVLIYNSHNRESFLPYLKGVTDPNMASHSKINVTKLTDKLVQDLNDKGIGSQASKTDILARLNQKGLKYSRSYQEERGVLQTMIASNKNLQYFVDIHRDSRRKKDTTIVLNGKSYAKIAFVIGGKNANYEKNAALASKMHKALDKKYPGLSRGVLLKKDKGDNGVYNQDLSSNAMLIEIGGVDNNFDEMYRTINAFADAFSEIYWDAKSVNGSSGSPAAK
ncbi:stage II sporulation protein P [Bacillus sp. MUM 13]|uniref:stage II sporulation protein P n=1 Tax=Bacillus sp. MUM 13 TaxID=1678001 RepID=UPI0008F5F41D|nr:stage II sporulation protein P [Bacillus sp. MUM 13]OIK13116.1 stage II sporulation protein P [Bacillus sp. MUM 13]